MTVGIRIKDPNTGAVLFDTTNRTLRVLTYISTNGTDGSASVSRVGGGITAYATSTGSGASPRVTVSGNTVRWEFDGPADAGSRICFMET